MPNVVKKMMVRELTSKLKDAEGMLLLSMKGLTVEETEELRNKLAESDIPLRMVPNRLTRIALKECGVETPDGLLKGNVGVSWGDAEAAIQAAKVVKEAQNKKEGRLEYLGGLMEGNLLSAREAALLATMPGRNELRAKLLGCLSGPARGLVQCMAGVPGGLARVLQARVDKAGGASDPAAAPAAPAGGEA